MSCIPAASAGSTSDDGGVPAASTCRVRFRARCSASGRRLRRIFTDLSPSEISGAAGDLGTLVPLLTALSRARAIRLGPTLFLNGLSNCAAGLLWDVPVCVQPMKSIAAVAIAEGLGPGAVTAAGVLVGGAVLLLGATGLVEAVNALVPPAVVSGLQCGIGLKLASAGMRMVADLGAWLRWRPESGAGSTGVYGDCIAVAVACAAFSLALWRDTPCGGGTHDEDRNDQQEAEAEAEEEREEERDRDGGGGGGCGDGDGRQQEKNPPRPPAAPRPVGLYLFLIGATFAAVTLAVTDDPDGRFGLPLRLFGAPLVVPSTLAALTPDDWATGALQGAVPQLPLTVLNSVVSVCALAHDLYPDRRRASAPPSRTDRVVPRTEMAVFVGAMNLVACSLGAMPSCCGAGGLAGQHRFGGRSGSCVFFLGACKIALAVFAGASAAALLDAVPASVLGVMLAGAGLELAATGLRMLPPGPGGRLGRKDLTVAVLTAGVVVSGVGGTHVAAIVGLAAHAIYGDGCDGLVRWARRRRRAGRPQSSSVLVTADVNNESLGV